MSRILLISSCLVVLFSCLQENGKKKINKKESIDKNIVVGFSITSKNNKLTSNTGTNVSINEMTTKHIRLGEKILFKGHQFTLEKKVDSALNFYSDSGSLILDIPFSLSIMSMPPEINVLKAYSVGEKIKLPTTCLIKTNNENFVISDIIFSKEILR